MKNLVKAVIVTTILVAMNLTLKAQVTFNTDWVMMDAHNDKYAVDAYEGVIGEPYLLSDWAKGTVRSGKAVLKDQMIKFDEVENRVLVRGEGGALKTFKTAISSFTIADKSKDREFEAGFLKGANNDIYTFFEVLVPGRTKFLRRNVKVISANKEYSGKIVKNITSETKYFISSPDQAPVNIKLDEKSILLVLADKKSDLISYINANKLNLKKVDDVAKLITHYNSL